MPRSNSRQLQEVSLDETCPCGFSKRKYRNCCKKRRFTWAKDNRGNLYKQQTIPEDMKDALLSAKKLFHDVMGRPPRKNDPVFLHSLGEPTLQSQREVLTALRKANVRPAIIYAYLQTDRVVADPKLLDPAEQMQYEEAIAEYYERLKQGQDESTLLDPSPHENLMCGTLGHVQLIFSYYLAHLARQLTQDSQEAFVQFFTDFLLATATRSLRAINILLNDTASYEAFFLVRSISENYLTMKYVGRNASYAQVLQAQIGLESGTPSYQVTAKGKTDYTRIVENATGKVLSVVTVKRMALTLDDYDDHLYKSVYSTISSAVHTRPSEAFHFFDGRGLAYLDADFTFSVLLNTHLLCVAISCHLLTSACQKYLRRDLQTSAQKSLLALAVGIESLPESRAVAKASLMSLVPRIVAGEPSLMAYWKNLLEDLNSTTV